MIGFGGDFELRVFNFMGVFYVEFGDIEEVREYFQCVVNFDEDGIVDEKIGGGFEKFFFLVQLSEDGGQDSVQWFDCGVVVFWK